MAKKNDYSYLEREIARARGNYSYHKYSFGGRMNIIAEPEKHLGRELREDELRKLGDDLDIIRREDFVGSLYPALKDLFMIYSKGDIILPRIDDFKHFDCEYDFIKHIVLNRSLSGLKLDDVSFNNLHMIRTNSEENIFSELSANCIDLYYMDGECCGFNGFISMREKRDESTIGKYILEHCNLRYPDKKELEKRGFYEPKKNLRYLQDKCYEECIGIEQAGLTSGEDIYDYFTTYFEKGDLGLEEKIRAILNKYFVDYVGGKVVASKEMIEDLDKHMREGIGSKLRRLPFRTKDYLKEGIKDKSITHAFNGSYERSAVEIKFMPLSEGYNAEIGEQNHPEYKDKQYKDLAKLLGWHDELNYMVANLCCSRKVRPENILGRYSHLLPKHEAYYEYDFDYDIDTQLVLPNT